MEYDEVLNFKKKTPNKKIKKSKVKTYEEIVKERQNKRLQEEKLKIDEESKIKDQKNKELNKLKQNERTAMVFELDLLGREFDSVSIDKPVNKLASASVGENDEIIGDIDDRILEYDFM